MTETAVASTTLTEFLQHSGRILPQVDQGEIILRRREGDDLVVLTRRHWKALSDSYLALAEAYRQGRMDAPMRGVSSPTGFALPWLSLLAPEDQATCLDELSKATIAALQSGRLADLAFLLAQWRATALATWDDEQRRKRPEAQIDDPWPLPRP